MSKKVIVGIIAAIVVAGVAYYALSPLFITLKGNEAIPTDKIDSSQAPEKYPDNVVSQGAQVIGTVGHPASGTARIITVSGKHYLRYENFKTINGPDIYVYLAKDLGAKDYVSLGKVRVTEGSVNYEIPDNVDISKYPYTLTWCKTFSVLFNSAKIGK